MTKCQSSITRLARAEGRYLWQTPDSHPERSRKASKLAVAQPSVRQNGDADASRTDGRFPVDDSLWTVLGVLAAIGALATVVGAVATVKTLYPPKAARDWLTVGSSGRPRDSREQDR